MTAFSPLLARLAAWLRQMLAEDNGNPSSLRAVMFGWHTPAAMVWTGLSIYHRHLEPIPESVGCLLASLTGLKVGQKFGEGKAPSAPAP